MTKREYVIAQAKLDAINNVMGKLKNMEELANEPKDSYSEYGKIYDMYQGEILTAVYREYIARVRKLRTSLIREIAEFAIEHPLDTL